jgi:hypothetical protein
MNRALIATLALAANTAAIAQTAPTPAPAPAAAPAAAPAPVSQREISGVKVDNAITLGGQRLPLNGAGIRYKAFIKVYVGSLYASRKVTDLQSLIAAPGAKRMHVVMLREIDAAELGKLLYRGIEDNTPKDQFFKFAGSFARVSNIFSEKKFLKPGETFSVDYVPGVGTSIMVNGKPSGEPFKEPEFFQAMMSIWLGPVPADFKLKDALLNTQS